MQGGRQRQNREARGAAGAGAHERNHPPPRGGGGRAAQTVAERGPAEEHAQDLRASRSTLDERERVAAIGATSGVAPSPPASEAAFGPSQMGGTVGWCCGGPLGAVVPSESPLDLDVTVLSFAQWVTEMKARQQNSSQQMQAEMGIIRNAITSNNTELGDFKRHSAAIQQQMQSEITEIRESLSNVFMEITNAVRNNAASDQDIKLKIQSLNEQAVRNETAFAQLAEAADQSQSKLRNAVQDMQHSSERMRDGLVGLNRHTESLDASLSERADGIAMEVEHISQDLRVQLERRKEQLKKMVNDVCGISNSLTGWMGDFTEQKKATSEMQSKIQSALYVLDQSQRREPTLVPEDSGGARRQTVQAAPCGAPARVSPQPQRTSASAFQGAPVPGGLVPTCPAGVAWAMAGSH